MAEQPVNLSTAIYLGVFSRAEQRVLQAIFKAITEGGGRCVATLAMLARDSDTSRATTRNAIAQAVAIGLLEKTERRSYYAVSFPNILTYGAKRSAASVARSREADRQSAQKNQALESNLRRRVHRRLRVREDRPVRFRAHWLPTSASLPASRLHAEWTRQREAEPSYRTVTIVAGHETQMKQ